MSYSEIEEEYGVAREDIQAVLEFMAELVEGEDFQFLPERTAS